MKTKHERSCWIKSKNIQLKENNDEDKKTKGTKQCVIKRKLKFQDYENCLRAAKIKNEINYSEKKKFNLDNLKKDLKEFV